MGKGRCAWKRRDGRRCRNQPQTGSPFCWKHREEAGDGLDPGVEPPATGDAGTAAGEWVSPPRRLTQKAVRDLNWYWKWLHILRAMGVDEGVRLPIFGNELPPDEPRLLVGDHELTAAAAAIFLGGTQLRVAVGNTAYNEACGRLQIRSPFEDPFAAEGSFLVDLFCWPGKGRILSAEPAGEYAGLPFISFLTLGPNLVVSAHPDIPRTADGLPDLRIFQLPPGQWHTLVPAPRPPADQEPRQRPFTDGPLTALRFFNDRVHKGAVEALSATMEWSEQDGFYRALSPSTTGKGGFAMRVGLRDDPGEEMTNFLQTREAPLIKAHYALWARWYAQTDGKPGQWAITSLHQFCADLGYTKHHKGGFPAERKQEAARLLDLLTAVEIEATFTPQGQRTAFRSLRGPLWQRRAAPDRHAPSGPHPEPAGGDNPSGWDPLKFAFSPGRWFEDSVWQALNRYIGQINAGLLRLSAQRDPVAIRICGYLASLARIDQYRPTPVRVETLLARIGMAGAYPNEPGKLLQVLRLNLNKLRQAGVIAGYDGLDDDTAEPDMDSPEQLARFDDYAPSPWRRRVIRIEWPAELTRQTPRLETGRQKASRSTARPPSV